jgi:metal-responsive CopG/Arc/MetJ family transcriptional regulator
MPSGVVKIAVTVPADVFRELEGARKRRGQTRSAAVQEALRHWLKSHKTAALAREYEAGYRRKPETRRDVDDALASAIGLLRDEDDW